MRAIGLPLTVNVVLHRGNIERLQEIIALAESLGADRLELANAQYYGWAFKNRALLLPTRPQIEIAAQLARGVQILYFLQRLVGWFTEHLSG